MRNQRSEVRGQKRQKMRSSEVEKLRKSRDARWMKIFSRRGAETLRKHFLSAGETTADKKQRSDFHPFYIVRLFTRTQHIHL
jgi:hypothetical protein